MTLEEKNLYAKEDPEEEEAEAEDEDEKEDDDDEEDEDEEEIVDPQDNLRSQCQETSKCIALKSEFDACEGRVNGRSETAEDCTQELFDFLHCTDHCVSQTLFSHLK